MAKTILVIDDDGHVLEVITLFLREAGYQVETAGSGEAGYQLTTSGGIDCVILDLDMPGMDGAEVAERLRLNPSTRDIPVLICTGLVKPNELDERQTVGRHEFIAKPVKRGDLLARVEALLRSRS